jgi:TPR repeat protein
MTKRQDVVLIVAAASLAVGCVASAPEVHQCDVLAANPADLQKTAAGISMNDIATNDALVACEAAVEKYTETPRFLFQLGRVHHSAKRYSEAVGWYQKAAEYHYAAAQSNLGYMYRAGFGVEKDFVSAVEWYRKAAEQGNAAAQATLGDMYLDGAGVEQSNVEAVAWFGVAATQGHEGAISNRDSVGAQLDPASLAEARELARELYKNYVEPFQ